jgi:formate--tetrahydrofolate ligase
VVVVATLRALKYHGGVDLKELNKENRPALAKGLANLEHHVRNIRDQFGLPCVVSINHFTFDTDAEIDLLRGHMNAQGVPVVVAQHWASGGSGAEDLARMVVELADRGESKFRFLYQDSDTLWDKMRAVAMKIYGAAEVTADPKVVTQIRRLQEEGYGHFPVCVAKTQSSFSTDPTLRGAPSGHVVNVREVRLSAGAEFIVMICGDIMTMPGLPKVPAAEKIDLDENNKVVGLF